MFKVVLLVQHSTGPLFSWWQQTHINAFPYILVVEQVPCAWDRALLLFDIRVDIISYLYVLNENHNSFINVLTRHKYYTQLLVGNLVVLSCPLLRFLQIQVLEIDARRNALSMDSNVIIANNTDCEIVCSKDPRAISASEQDGLKIPRSIYVIRTRRLWHGTHDSTRSNECNDESACLFFGANIHPTKNTNATDSFLECLDIRSHLDTSNRNCFRDNLGNWNGSS